MKYFKFEDNLGNILPCEQTSMEKTILYTVRSFHTLIYLPPQKTVQQLIMSQYHHHLLYPLASQTWTSLVPASDLQTKNDITTTEIFQC